MKQKVFSDYRERFFQFPRCLKKRDNGHIIRNRQGREGNSIFNIGFSELILVLLIAFLVVGPKDLPRVARWLGRMVRKLRKMILEVKKETGWYDLEKELKETKADMDNTVKDLKKDLDITPELKGAAGDLNKSLNSVKEDLHRTGQDLQKEAKEIKEETMKK